MRFSFLVVAALLGLSTNRLDFMLAWVGVLFVSILIHELGHALVARSFGSEVEIELNAIGGLTSWTAEGELSPGRRALVAAAGSATGLTFGGLVWLIATPFAPFGAFWGFVIEYVVLVNVFWGLLNWLPIRPLDGGHLFTALLEKLAPKRGETIGNVVFALTAGIALVVAIRFRLFLIAALAGWLLWSEFSRHRPPVQRGPIPTLDFAAPRSDVPGGDYEEEVIDVEAHEEVDE